MRSIQLSYGRFGPRLKLRAVGLENRLMALGVKVRRPHQEGRARRR